MNDPSRSPQTDNRNDFLREAETERMGFVAEFVDFLKHNKKWWLLPILLIIVLVGAIVFLASASPAATPFIYPFF